MPMRAHFLLIAVVAGCSSPAKPGPSGAPTTPVANSGTGVPTAAKPMVPATAWANTTPAVDGIDADAFHKLATTLGLDGPAAPKAVDAAATTRLATITEHAGSGADPAHTIRILRVTGTAVTVDGEAELPEPGHDVYASDRVWRDANELVLLYSNGSLYRFAGKTVEPIARPAKKYFKAKRVGGDAKVDRDERLIATPTGEVWLQHCVWAYQGDDDPCSSEVYVRILPSVKTTTTAPPERAELASQPLPAGWSFTVVPTPNETDGREAAPANRGALDCAGPDGAHAAFAVVDGSEGYSIDDAVVVSTQPVIQVVRDWWMGEADDMPTDHLVVGCTLPELDNPWVAHSPSGYWVVELPVATSDGPPGMILAWNGRIVTELPAVTSLVFAPNP